MVGGMQLNALTNRNRDLNYKCLSVVDTFF
jgi:hypothetical protein